MSLVVSSEKEKVVPIAKSKSNPPIRCEEKTKTFVNVVKHFESEGIPKMALQGAVNNHAHQVGGGKAATTAMGACRSFI